MAFSLALLGASTYEVPIPASYDLLATETLTSSTTSVTFSSLGDYAADYDHLQIRSTLATSTSTSRWLTCRFNGDTGSNYSFHRLRGTGSSVVTSGAGNYAEILVVVSNDTVGSMVMDILDYGNSSKNTTTRTFHGSLGRNEVSLTSGAWFNTNAVTSILLQYQSNDIVTGSRFSLYGIRKVA